MPRLAVVRAAPTESVSIVWGLLECMFVNCFASFHDISPLLLSAHNAV